jgi:hypothetical protein
VTRQVQEHVWNVVPTALLKFMSATELAEVVTGDTAGNRRASSGNPRASDQNSEAEFLRHDGQARHVAKNSQALLTAVAPRRPPAWRTSTTCRCADG